jgi:transposase
MLQLTPQSRIFLATEPVDFRKGIDGLVAVCRQVLGDNPLSGAVYVFRNRSGTAIKLLFYDPSLRCIGTFGHGTPVLTALTSRKGSDYIDTGIKEYRLT